VSSIDEHRRARAKLVGANIRLARKLFGASQQQLALLLGVKQPYLSDWERGVHEPSPARLNQIANILEQELGFFFTEHADNSNPHEAVA
jgi:transcriptional regulator with XRE-family HTH domain